MGRSEIIARARELDDELPLTVCPGCGQDLSQDAGYRYHYRPGEALIRPRQHGVPFPFIEVDTLGPDPCPWDSDYLAARAFRRRLIEEEG